MDTLKDFKYFLRRAGNTEHKDKREKQTREKEGDWGSGETEERD